MNLRDPVLYRILHAEHPRTGNAWCIYPTYDFAHGQSDAIEGITHSICTLEFEDHRPLYDWLIENLPVPSRPHQYEFARLNITYTVMSKRILTRLVTRGHVTRLGRSAHADTGRRAPARRPAGGAARVRAPRRRRRAYSVVDVAMLDAAIRELLNRTAPRRMAVLRPLKLVIENYPEGRTETLEAHQQSGGSGRRHAPDHLRSRALRRARRLHGGPAEEVLPSVARPGGAAALRLLRHLPDGGEERRGRGGRTALHLRSGDARRQLAADGRKVQATLHWVAARMRCRPRCGYIRTCSTAPIPAPMAMRWPT